MTIALIKSLSSGPGYLIRGLAIGIDMMINGAGLNKNTKAQVKPISLYQEIEIKYSMSARELFLDY